MKPPIQDASKTESWIVGAAIDPWTAAQPVAALVPQPAAEAGSEITRFFKMKTHSIRRQQAGYQKAAAGIRSPRFSSY